MAELVWLRPVVGCTVWKGKMTQLRWTKIHLSLDNKLYCQEPTVASLQSCF